MRKILSLVLALMMVLSLGSFAFAEETTAVGTPRSETLIVECRVLLTFLASSMPTCPAPRWASASIS